MSEFVRSNFDEHENGFNFESGVEICWRCGVPWQSDGTNFEQSFCPMCGTISQWVPLSKDVIRFHMIKKLIKMQAEENGGMVYVSG